MTVEQAFELCNLAALISWLALIFAPRVRFVREAIRWGTISALSALYAVLIAVFFFRVEGGGFTSLSAFQTLFSDRYVALAGFVHYLAFDLFVGLWIAERADAVGISRLIQAPVLVATFFFGPLGFVLFQAISGLSSAFRNAGPQPPRIDMTQIGLTKAEQSTLATIAICVGAMLVAGLAFTIDGRTLHDVSVWMKPLKFAISLTVHLCTLLIFVSLLSDNARQSRLAGNALIVASTSALIELLYICLQAARGRASHFNSETLIEAFMYHVMGGAALTLVGATALIGVLILRSARSDAGPCLRLGAGWGAILGALATLIVAGAMASGLISGPDPWVGEPRTAAVLPVVGWSRQSGDLRVSHFMATHLIQAMALSGLLADRWLRGSAGRLVVILTGAGCLAFAVATFIQALNGKPFIAA